MQVPRVSHPCMRPRGWSGVCQYSLIEQTKEGKKGSRGCDRGSSLGSGQLAPSPSLEDDSFTPSQPFQAPLPGQDPK